MEIERLNNAFKEHLKAELEVFNTNGYKLSVEWEIDFSSSKNDDNNIFLNDKTIYFVLSKLPSVNLEGLVIQSIMISALCEQQVLPHAMAILENYQRKVITSKIWIEDVLMTETYNSPSLSQNYIAMDVSYGVEITMSGTILFNEKVNDIEELYIFNQKINFINAVEAVAMTSTSNAVFNNLKYSKGISLPTLSKIIPLASAILSFLLRLLLK